MGAPGAVTLIGILLAVALIARTFRGAAFGPASDVNLSDETYWHTEHEKTSQVDADAERYAEPGVYWDECGHRHVCREYTRENGELMRVDDHIIAYNDLNPDKTIKQG